MLILTNGLTDIVDEGFLKVASSLVKRLKKAKPDIEIVSYERKSEITDRFITVNKFMTNKSVRELCKKHGDVLYIPFPTKKWVMALRVYLLSRFAKKLNVMLVLKTPIGKIGKLFLKKSGAGVIVFSRDAADFYSGIVGEQRVTYLKTGVDTEKFSPVSPEDSAKIKARYGLDADKKLVLHVGHLNEGRNIRTLTEISEEYQVLLITSTLTKNEADRHLKNDLLARANIKIIDDFIPRIEDIYRMSDVYFFPVVESGHCIDVPLSCLEAAACGKPIVTTRFGEMTEFEQVKGVIYIDAFDGETINKKIGEALYFNNVETREAVTGYDWQKAVDSFCQ